MDILLKSRKPSSQQCSWKSPEYMPFTRVINMQCAKERDTDITEMLNGVQCRPGLMARDTVIEEGLQNPATKEAKCNT